MNFAEVIKQLNNKHYNPIYLLHGEESYYIDLISDYIENKILTESEKSFNQTIVYGKDADILSVISMAKQFPMMSNYQVLIIKEAQDLKIDKAEEQFLAYCENPLKSTVFVLCYKYGKFDKRKKVYKTIEKNGLIFESPLLYDSKIPAWISQYLKDKNYQIHPKAATLLADYLGNDLSKISNELEKLLLNTPADKEIGLKEIQDNIGISKDYNVFELQAALSKRDFLKANQIINYFNANTKAHPAVLILGNLISWFTKILKCHYINDKSLLAKELGVNPYFIKDFEEAARTFPAAKTFLAISILREYDIKLKGVDVAGQTDAGELMKELVWKLMH